MFLFYNDVITTTNELPLLRKYKKKENKIYTMFHSHFKDISYFHIAINQFCNEPLTLGDQVNSV